MVSRRGRQRPETINYRTLKPERDGLFCERIFGPTKDWECNCGKYKRTRFKGVVCDKCGVEVTTRQGAPRAHGPHRAGRARVSHIWYFKGIPSRMGTLLNISPRALEQVLYFASYIVLDPGKTRPAQDAACSPTPNTEYQIASSRPQEGGCEFRVGIGAEAVRETAHGDRPGRAGRAAAQRSCRSCPSARPSATARARSASASSSAWRSWRPSARAATSPSG